MDCERYLELLSARLDGELTESKQRELEAHLASCPECRAAGAQLETLRSAFDALEDVPAPEGFTQRVMGRVRLEEAPKVIPLFRRFRALTGLAACLALAVGLYCASRPRGTDNVDAMTRDFVPEQEYADTSLPGEAPRIDTRSIPEDPRSDGENIVGELVLDRMPEGAWELIPVSQDGPLVPEALMEQIAQMAQEQGISASRSSGAEENGLYRIVILNETE